MDKAWSELLRRGLDDLDETLPPDLPLVAAHRDFAHWNVRPQRHGLFVFDWEYAGQGFPPLLDLFHWLLLPRVRRADISLACLNRAVSQVEAAASGLFPAEMRAEPRAQLLAYLLDLCLFYLESRDGLPGDCTVLPRCGGLLRERKEWLWTSRA